MHQYVKTGHIIIACAFNPLLDLVELRIQQTHYGEVLGL
jgi:hypothetical protein